MDDRNRQADRKTEPDNVSEQPEIYAVSRGATGIELGRRSFLQATALGVGSLALTPIEDAVGALKREAGQPGYAHTEAVTALALHPDGRLLVSGDRGGWIKLWQMPEGTLLKSWTGGVAAIGSLAFLPGTAQLASVDSNGSVTVWKLPEGTALPALRFEGNKGTVLAVPRTGEVLLTGADSGAIVRWWTRDGTRLGVVEGHTAAVTALAATPDGALLISGGKDNTLRRWSTESGVPAGAPVKVPAEVSALALSPDGALAVVVLGDGSVHLWDMPEGKTSRPMAVAVLKPVSVAVRPQRDLAVVGRVDPDVALVPLASSVRPVEYLKGHSGKVTGVAIGPDGNVLVTGSEDKTIRVWNLGTRTCERVLIDLDASYASSQGSQYGGTDIYGRSITYTLPCGSPVPAGAVCTCNCVPGTRTVPDNHSRQFGTGGICTCDLICTCNTICTCQSVGSSSFGSHYWHPC